MKHPIYLIILLACGVLALAWRGATRNTDNSEVNNMENMTIENIMTRASVRSYKGTPVSEEQVDTLLRAAMSAPTAVNKQPWRFVVIEQREVLDSLAVKFPNMSMLKRAPLAIVMCGDMNDTLEDEGREYWIQDVSAATENLLLATHAMGLGAVWCGIYPISDRVSRLSEILHLPSEIVPLGVVSIGYPDGETAPKDKWKPEKVHYGTWDGAPATL